MARFLISATPLTGHMTPGLSLANALVEHGHEVWWYSTRKFQSKIEATGAKFVPRQKAVDYDDTDLEEAFPQLKGKTGFWMLRAQIKSVFIEDIEWRVHDLLPIVDEFKPDVILTDNTGAEGMILGSQRHIPWAIYGVTPLGLRSKDTPPDGIGMLPSRSTFGKIRDRVLYWLIQNILLRDVQNTAHKMLIRLGLPPLKSFVFDIFRESDLFIQPTVKRFEYPRNDLPPQVHFVGPFLPEAPEDFELPEWWDEMESGRPVIHITQGTLQTNYDDLLIPTIKALAKEDYLIVATTGGKSLEKVDLKPLPDNVRLEKFIPYALLLPHVDVMVTNGGYGGVQAALAYGVPLVVAGQTEDKPEVNARVEWAGVGINLRTQTPKEEDIREAVKEVLNAPVYHETAKGFQEEIARLNPLEMAVELLEKLVTK